MNNSKLRAVVMLGVTLAFWGVAFAVLKIALTVASKGAK